MGRASAVLTRRVAAGLALLGVLLAYYLFFRLLPNLPTSADVLFVAFVLIPAVFALVWVALPLRRANRLLWIAIGLTALAVASSFAGLEVLANFAKLGAATTVAFWFLGFFETALWVALVALLIPIVDSYSVWRGPTRHIITERPEVFNAFSFSFPLMGERQVFVTWREPLDGPSSFDIYRDPGGKRNDEPIVDDNDNGRLGYAEAELDADRDYRYRIVSREGGSAAIVARADDANDGEQQGAPTSDRKAPTDLRVDSVDSTAKLGLPDLLFFALFLAARGPLQAAAPSDLDRDDGLVRPDALRDVLPRGRRAAGAAAARDRVPRRQRRPALADVARAARGRAGDAGAQATRP